MSAQVVRDKDWPQSNARRQSGSQQGRRQGVRSRGMHRRIRPCHNQQYLQKRLVHEGRTNVL